MVSISPEEILKFLTDRIAPIVRSEVDKLRSVPELVDSMRDELEMIKDFLYNTKAEEDEAEEVCPQSTRKKVKKVREIMFQIEDVLDRWHLLRQQQQLGQQNDHVSSTSGQQLQQRRQQDDQQSSTDGQEQRQQQQGQKNDQVSSTGGQQLQRQQGQEADEQSSTDVHEQQQQQQQQQGHKNDQVSSTGCQHLQQEGEQSSTDGQEQQQEGGGGAEQEGGVQGSSTNGGDQVQNGCLEGTNCWGLLDVILQWLNYKFPLSIKSEYSIACEVILIRKAIEKITGTEGRNYYGSIFEKKEDTKSEEQTSWRQDPALRPLYRDESDLVAFGASKERIKKLWGLEMERESTAKKGQEAEAHKGPSLLAAWGEPGVGKTTLVHKVFEDPDIKKHFPLRIWITAARGCNRVDLLKSLLKQFLQQAQNKIKEAESEPKEAEASITEALREHLGREDKRYLVVLDGVTEMEELAKCMKAALLPSQGKNGSRILVTMDTQRLANYWKTSWPNGEAYKVEILSKEDAEKLFNKKAFGGADECRYKLQDIRKDILEDCQGLPYLIEKAGALFSTTDKWVELFHRFQSNPLLGDDKRAFLSRYYDMPGELKPCFLYLSMFPKGYEVDRMRIVRLWIAEGFITSHHRMNTLEEIAEDYLNQLVEGGMVSARERDETGRNRKIQFHRFWHQMVLSKLDDQRFCLVFPRVNKSSSNLSHHHERYRRLSIQEDMSDTVIPSSVRSIFSFVEPQQFPIRWKWPYPDAAFLLRVLDLQGAKELKQVPKAVGQLHNLRYLSLRGTKVENVNEFIGELWNLQTLDLKQSKVDKLPKEIQRLSKLRHLLVYKYDTDHNKVDPVRIPSEALASFVELQKLAFVDANSSPGLVSQLNYLKQLRRLAITNIKTEQGEPLCESIKVMENLRALSVTAMNGNVLDLDHIQPNSSPPDKFPKHLERLYLNGKLKGRLPKWIPELSHLVKLRLRCRELESDPLPLLAKLPELIVLELVDYLGQTLNFESLGFENLEVLRLKNLHRLRFIIAEEEDLARLQEATFEDCSMVKIEEVPSQIKQVLKIPISEKQAEIYYK